jgi:hypothetical protein
MSDIAIYQQGSFKMNDAKAALPEIEAFGGAVS